MSDVDILGKAMAAVRERMAGTSLDSPETLARAALEAVGVLGAAAQPLPVHQPGEPSMHERVIEWAIEVAPGRATVALCELLEDRKAFGLAKYGTTLQIGGPREPRADAADEVADAVVYAQQGLERALLSEHAGRIVWWRRRRDALGYELLALVDETEL